jgi:hypothetical protein
MARLGVPVGGRVRKLRAMGDPLARLPLKSPGLLIRLVGLPIRQQDRPNRPDKPDKQPNLPSIFTRVCEEPRDGRLPPFSSPY